MNKNHWITSASLALVLTASLFVAACGKKETALEQGEPVKVKVVEIASREMVRLRTFPATLESERRITLSTKVMGNITYLPVEQGSTVQAGQLLVKIDAGDIKAKRAQVASNLIEAKAMLKNVETNYNRMKDLFEKGSATKKEFDDASTAFESAKAKVQSIEQMDKELADVLSYTTLTSPVSGFISQKFVQMGDMASPAMPLLTVEGGGVTKATAQVPESDIYLFKQGDEVELSIDALGGEKLKGKIEQVSQSGARGSRQFDVKIRIINPTNKNLKSGMFANVLLHKDEGKGITIPQDLLVKRGDLEGVFVLSSANESLLRWVRTGKRVAGQVEILSGLADGDKLIVSAEGKLQDGKRVEVIQ